MREIVVGRQTIEMSGKSGKELMRIKTVENVMVVVLKMEQEKLQGLMIEEKGIVNAILAQTRLKKQADQVPRTVEVTKVRKIEEIDGILLVITGLEP